MDATDRSLSNSRRLRWVPAPRASRSPHTTGSPTREDGKLEPGCHACETAGRCSKKSRSALRLATGTDRRHAKICLCPAHPRKDRDDRSMDRVDQALT